ncbi:MAG: S-layer homology domain-containing protein [Candidatus Peregrinibacteria bacterium]|nr:S-layer homology domain-containing protein [Candidatus Peregrinibacteria bacterium]
MKKTILAASILSLFITTNIVSANSLKEVIPGSTDMYLEFNTTSKNPLQDYISKEMPKQFANSIFSDETDQTQKEKVIKAFGDILSNTTLSFGMNYPEDFSAGLKVTDTQFQNFIDALGSKATVESENPKIYLTREDFFFTKSGDLLLAAPTKEKLLSILNNTGDILTSDTNFKDVSSDFSAEDAITIFISNSFVKNIFKNSTKAEEMATAITDSFKAFGLTIRKTSTGINSKIITVFDSAKAKELGLNTTANNFTPLLYKVMPSENPIFYTEASNLKNSLDTAINLIEKTGKVPASELKIPTEIDTYLSILENEIAVYIQKDTQILPAVTIILNTSAHKDIAADIVTKLTSALEEEFKNNNTEYQQSVSKGLTTYTFDLNKLDKEGQIPDGMNKISITIGITPENYLILSSYSKIASKYGEGLTKNSDFKTAFSNLNQTVAGITYGNIENLASWYDQVLNTVEQVSTNDFTKKQITETRDLLKQAKKPWHDFAITKKNTETKSTTEINLNFDINQLNLSYFKTFYDFSKANKLTFKSFTNSRQTFNDTPADGWYYSDVKELSARGVINGYGDNSFKPNNQITRAEFLTMVLRAFEGNNFDYNYGESTSKFKDVKDSDWFANAVTQGTNDGLVSGYSDNSFHPNSPITRAEATALLHKMIKFKYGEQVKLPVRAFADPFTDVKPNDWYYEDVQRIYGYSIIDGDSNGTSFSPNRNLNRAEASKIINKALKGIDEVSKGGNSFPEMQ